MQLTSGQIEQITSALQEGKHRVSVSLTDTQQQLWHHEATVEDQGRDDTVARVSRIRAAAIRPGFFGDLLRAITRWHGFRMPVWPVWSESISRCWSDFERERRNSPPTRSND